LLLCLLCAPIAQASDNHIVNAEIIPSEDGYVVNAEVDLTLGSRLEDALRHGLSLYFLLEFEVTHPRWYWLDETIIDQTLAYRLYYHALTRSYRLSIGSLHQSFDTLEAAVRTMLRVRNWNVAPHGALVAGQSYKAAIRMAFDASQLPKPFQLTAFTSKDWDLSTDWLRWVFLATSPEPE
jgi:hypothetical protein